MAILILSVNIMSIYMWFYRTNYADHVVHGVFTYMFFLWQINQWWFVTMSKKYLSIHLYCYEINTSQIALYDSLSIYTNY